MAFRFRKSFKIAKGVRVTFGKTGVGLSIGKRGLRHNIHSSGRRTSTVGIPGSGVSYVKNHSKKKRKNTSNASLQRQLERQYEAEENAKLVEEYEQLVENLISFHKTSETRIDWKEIARQRAPFVPPTSESKTTEAQQAYEEWKQLNAFAKRVVIGYADVYMEVVDELKPFDELLDYGSEFDVTVNDIDELEIEFKAQTEGVIPDYGLALTKTGKLSKRKLTKTRYYELVQDYVCSYMIRIARDFFAILPIETVIIHAVDEHLNTATGHMEEITICSVSLDRKGMEGLNFNHIAPSDALETFPCNMKHMKTSGFREVERINE